MGRLVTSVIVAVVAIWLASSTIFVVDQRSSAIVFALGEVKQVITEPGLHFKLPPPFQNVMYLDKRIQTLDTPDADRFITAEKMNVLVDAYVKWRIVDPRLYFVSFGADERRTQDRLSQIVKAALNDEITNAPCAKSSPASATTSWTPSRRAWPTKPSRSAWKSSTCVCVAWTMLTRSTIPSSNA